MGQNRPFPPRRPPPPQEPEPPPSRFTTFRERSGRFLTRLRGALLVLAGVLVALLAMILYSSFQPPPQRLTQRDINAAVARAMASATPAPWYAAQVYETVRRSLVQVEAVSTASGSAEQPIGAGVVIDEQGTILAALHVLGDADSARVVFADGSESEASVVKRLPENDLVALLPEVIPDDLMPATLAGSGGLRVGDQVVAVGNPFGMSSSLAQGVVSGLDRQYRLPQTGVALRHLIQFDAAVNPGSAGGPLLDRNGDVVGIVAGPFNPSQEVFIGIGFAVPIESATGGLGSPID